MVRLARDDDERGFFIRTFNSINGKEMLQVSSSVSAGNWNLIEMFRAADDGIVLMFRVALCVSLWVSRRHIRLDVLWSRLFLIFLHSPNSFR